MRKSGLLLLVSTIVLATASGAAVACVDGALDSGNASTSIFTNGCTIGDKLFNNFSLSGASPTATSVAFNMTGQEFHIVLVNGLSAGSPAFMNTFSWGFDISVFQGPDVIIALKDQAFYAITSGTVGVSVTDQKSAPGGVTCSVATGVSAGCLFTMVPGSETAGPSTLATGKTALHSAITFSPGTGGILNSIEADFAQVTPSAVPEPASFALFGSGLALLGLLPRKK